MAKSYTNGIGHVIFYFGLIISDSTVDAHGLGRGSRELLQRWAGDQGAYNSRFITFLCVFKKIISCRESVLYSHATQNN